MVQGAGSLDPTADRGRLAREQGGESVARRYVRRHAWALGAQGWRLRAGFWTATVTGHTE